jgi:hypothetical protein
LDDRAIQSSDNRVIIVINKSACKQVAGLVRAPKGCGNARPTGKNVRRA